MIEVTDSCMYSIVSQNDMGDYSKVIQVRFINLDDRNRLIAETAPQLDPAERVYRFQNPVNKPGLIVLLKDIISTIKADKRISDHEILEAFAEMTEELKPGEKGSES
jgi:hypothetical protein